MRHKDLQSLDYSYLRDSLKGVPPIPPLLETKKGFVRRIFHSDDLLHLDEEKALKSLADTLNSEDVPPPPLWWTTRDSLRFLYISSFDTKQAAKKIIDHWLWLAELADFELSATSTRMLVENDY